MAASAKQSFYSKTLPSMLKNNPKQFWKYINPKPHKPLSLVDDDNKPIPDHNVAHVLNTVFSSVFTSEPCTNLPECPYLDHPPMNEITFEVNGITKLIESLKFTSSAGIDGINSKLLKNTKHVTSTFLCHIFQQSLSSGVVPQDWKVGKIIPVPKKGSSSSCNNYRPISLTSVCSKLMEHIIYSHVVKFLASCHYFNPNQHGFQKGMSCETQLVLFINDISSHLDQNIPVDTLFLDFQMALDKIPHKRLFLKLTRLNLNPPVYEWLCDFLSNRQQFVCANQLSSRLSPVVSGVPQGTVLGPLLFLIYINDLPNGCTSKIRLFADDCVIYRPILNNTDILTLQSDLSLIESWCNKWLMSLNVSKTSLLTFHRRQSFVSTKYIIAGSEICAVTSYKYLGVNLCNNLTWSLHISNISNAANCALGYLRRNLRPVPSPVKLLAYLTLVRPKLEYACSVWDPHQTNLLNRSGIHTKSCS